MKITLGLTTCSHIHIYLGGEHAEVTDKEEIYRPVKETNSDILKRIKWLINDAAKSGDVSSLEFLKTFIDGSEF